MQKTAWLQGALVGAILTAPLIAILYLADAIIGLPFVAFLAFDWFARAMDGPFLGAILTIGIDSMVNTLIFLGTDVSETAKPAENLLAMLGLLSAGTVSGAVLFALLERPIRVKAGDLRPGAAMGLLVAIVLMLISINILGNTASSGQVIASLIWTFVAFIGWGTMISWSHGQLHPTQSKRNSANPDSSQAGEIAPTDQNRQADVEVLDRRRFLIRVGGASAAVTVVGAGLGATLGRRDEVAVETPPSPFVAPSGEGQFGPEDPEAFAVLPNEGDPVEPAPGTRPEYTPLAKHYQIDINSRPLEISGDGYLLKIFGLVDQPLELSLSDIRTRYEPQNEYVTLACISNRIGGSLIGTTRWTGARLSTILNEAGIQPGAKWVEVKSFDGFHEVVELDLIMEDDRIMLAYAWDGKPLLSKHGFPLRIWIPNRYGMKQPKWIESIEVIDDFRAGYWVRRGWSEDAIMRATSVIDTVATDSVFERDGRTFVPIGGIAHAGDRSISKVEIRVDDGAWQEAALRTPLSEVSWVIWRYEWPFEEGRHLFQVRCVDGSGNAQIETSSDVRPNGATGIHEVRWTA